MRRSLTPVLLIYVFVPTFLAAALSAETGAQLTRLSDRVRIEVEGKLFSEYIFASTRRPYLYPILMPDGTGLSRDFPMKQTPGEEHDHPHHLALRFAHSSVNGVDFWNEDPAGGHTPKGTIVQEALLETSSGATGVIRTTHRWLAPDGHLICRDETTIRVRAATAGGRMLDYEVTLHALPDTPLLIGDDKDGTMAIRLAQWMTLPHRYEKHEVPGSGHIVTSAGVREGAA